MLQVNGIARFAIAAIWSPLLKPGICVVEFASVAIALWCAFKFIRAYGTIEIGQCTIVSDETGAIDKHEDLISILKTDYSVRGKTPKINDNTRNPEFFSTYCFKIIIFERTPNLKDARGVLDGSFSFTTYKGRPKYDIKETLEPQGNPVRQQRLDTLNDFRKLMLIYRLLHMLV